MSSPASGSAYPLADVRWRGIHYPVAVPRHETDEFQGELMRKGRPHQERLLAAMASRLVEDDLVIDVGAGVGNHALFLGHVARARVVAYEPDRERSRAVEQGVAAGHLDGRVIVRTCAVGSLPGRDRGDRPAGGSHGIGSSGSGVADDVEVVRLDDEKFDSPVRLIRVDVGGAEFDVLEGATALISNDQPLLFVACVDQDEFDAVEDWLSTLGYSLSGSFNARPVHLFAPQALAGRAAVDALRRGVHARYELEATVTRLRKSQAAANDRAAGAGERQRALTQQLRDQKREVARLQKRVQELESSRALRLARAAGSLRKKLRRTGPVAAPTLRGAGAGRGEDASAVQRPADQNTADQNTAEDYPTIVARGGLSAFDRDALKAAEQAALRSARTLAERLARGDRRPRFAAICDDVARAGLSPHGDWLELAEPSHDAQSPEARSHEARSPEAQSVGAQLDAFAPDLLVVTSARVESLERAPGGPEAARRVLRETLAYCGEHAVPTVFWDLHDPDDPASLVATAAGFDHVLTTDPDRITRYRLRLGHDRVHFLPHACAPAQHAPGRADDLPDQALVLADGSRTAEPDGAGPTEVHPASTAQRRVLELVGSGVVTASTYSRTLSGMLGDLVVMGDDAGWIRRRLSDLQEGGADDRDRFRLMGLRKVHAEHTYAARLDRLLAVAAGEPFVPRRPLVDVLVPVDTAEQVERMAGVVGRQTGVEVRTTFVSDDPAVAAAAERHGLTARSRSETSGSGSAGTSVADACRGSLGIAVLDPRDWHGPTYLLDLVLALGYGDATVIGRRGFALAPDGRGPVLTDAVRPYSGCDGLVGRSALVRAPAAGTAAGSDSGSGTGSPTIADLLDDDPAALAALPQFAIDRFDYCRDGAGLDDAELQPLVGALPDTRTGYPSAELYRMLDATGQAPADPERPVLSTPALLDTQGSREHVQVETDGEALVFTSRLAKGKGVTWWLRRRLPVDQVAPSGRLPLRLTTSGGLELGISLRWLDGDGKAIQSTIRPANRDVTVHVPVLAKELELGVRITGPGTARLEELTLAHPTINRPLVPGTADYLVLSDHYASYDDLYKYAFVHDRVRAYRDAGLSVEVFRLRQDDPPANHEYEGVEVTTGTTQDLRAMLERGQVKHVLVHFLSWAMWSVLRDYADDLPITVWVHGYEVQPWWRRRFNYPTAEERDQVRAVSANRIRFWRRVVDDLPPDTHLVFVSQHFADTTLKDLDRVVPPGQLHIVHNPVNTDLFEYRPKSADQRLRILSIRPYASPVYANDLAVAAVLDLAQEPWFDDLHFRFVGDGPLFESTLAPISRLPNVTTTQGFLTQPEIADLHASHGVFLVPSRMDSQGVSRDEAMSSGLVPVASRVAAVPEFLSEREGFLAEPEDHVGLADAIRLMYHQPELFLARSAAAAARVRRQSGRRVVIPQELAILRREH